MNTLQLKVKRNERRQDIKRTIVGIVVGLPILVLVLIAWGSLIVK